MEPFDNMTMHEWLGIWLNTYPKRQVKQTTYKNYQYASGIYKKWSVDKPLAMVEEIDLQNTLNFLADLGYSYSLLRFLLYDWRSLHIHVLRY